jgi:mannose-1-phosphate guanylyltransferase/mannose-6-phosphate isomerase
MTNIHPVILSGGSGTRLWPLSREAYPKQFLPLMGELSPFQDTLVRLQGMAECAAPIVVTNKEHRFMVLDQFRDARCAPGTVYLEPFGRNTAPAAGVVAYGLMEQDPEALMLLLPADHAIGDHAAFAAAVRAGAEAAQSGALVVFGVEPRWAEPGYGYIERGEPVCLKAGEPAGFYRVASFIEKPELEIAQGLVASGRHYWNSGMFLFKAGRFAEELEQLEPALAGACRAAATASPEVLGVRTLDEAAFGHCRSVSIDYAVIERTESAVVVPAGFPWSDIGSWHALWDGAPKDAQGNVTQGDVHLDGVKNSYLRSSHRLVVGIGLEDVVVVETADALLVARQSDTGRVREAVEHFKSKGRPECRFHRRVHRPWGYYEDIDKGERFRVKRITVHPGGKLSLQLHHHRAEHWIVVKGTARITRGDKTMLITENQSTYIPLGVHHRLENPGKVPLQIIEVQSGAYLEEDDIVRLEDSYHRA